jgi:hypothetical protein
MPTSVFASPADLATSENSCIVSTAEDRSFNPDGSCQSFLVSFYWAELPGQLERFARRIQCSCVTEQSLSASFEKTLASGKTVSYQFGCQRLETNYAFQFAVTDGHHTTYAYPQDLRTIGFVAQEFAVQPCANAF